MVGHHGVATGERPSPYLEAGLDSVVIADLSGRIVKLNPAAERRRHQAPPRSSCRRVSGLVVAEHASVRRRVWFDTFERPCEDNCDPFEVALGQHWNDVVRSIPAVTHQVGRLE